MIPLKGQERRDFKAELKIKCTSSDEVNIMITLKG